VLDIACVVLVSESRYSRTLATVIIF